MSLKHTSINLGTTYHFTDVLITNLILNRLIEHVCQMIKVVTKIDEFRVYVPTENKLFLTKNGKSFGDEVKGLVHDRVYKKKKTVMMGCDG